MLMLDAVIAGKWLDVGYITRFSRQVQQHLEEKYRESLDSSFTFLIQGIIFWAPVENSVCVCVMCDYQETARPSSMNGTWMFWSNLVD